MQGIGGGLFCRFRSAAPPPPPGSRVGDPSPGLVDWTLGTS